MSERFFSRRDFLKLAAITGGAIFISTRCIPNKEKALFIPLEEILADPEKYKDIKNLATKGYPEQIGEETFYTAIPLSSTRIDWITTTKETYLLHTSQSTNSPSIGFTTNDSIYFPYAPLKLSGDNLPNEPYQITGRLDKVKIKNKNGDAMQEVYVIDVFTSSPLATTTAQSTK